MTQQSCGKFEIWNQQMQLLLILMCKNKVVFRRKIHIYIIIVTMQNICIKKKKGKL